MRFTPITLFGSGEQESCISVRGIGAVSESFTANGVNWDVLMYSASQQSGGGGTEQFQLHVDSGSTSHAIVVVVGGGGAGSSDGNGGGGGGVTVQTEVNLNLTDGVPYNVRIGQGADGTSRITLPGLPFSGEDGVSSIFGSPYMSITANGGEGGVLGGNGGDSGNGNTSTGEGGAGAGTGSNDNDGGTGYTIYKNLTLDLDNKIVRVGGGGQGENSTGDNKYSENYGAGTDVNPSPGNEIDGHGGQTDNLGVVTYGGGGTGGQYFRSGDSTYISSKGGGGFIMVAVPTNLCESSLYSKGNIVTENLLSNFDANHATSFGKNFYSRFFKDTQRITNLGNTSTSPSTYEAFFKSNIDDGCVIFSYDGSVKVLEEVEDFFPSNREVNYSLTGSLPLECSNEFTIEWTGEMPVADANGNGEVLRLDSTSTSAHLMLFRESTGQGGQVVFRYNDGTSNQDTTPETLDTNVHHHVVTFDGTDIKYYIDTTLKDTITTSVTSSLDTPNVEYFALNQSNPSLPGSEGYFFSSSRFYVSDLDSTQIEQNYSASLGL